MRRDYVLFGLLLLLFYVSVFATQKARAAETTDGVLTEERIINLPQDQEAWYLSVIGDGERYANLISLFENDTQLRSLRDQVKFCPVETNSNLYRERYAANVSGLPTVRLQEANGTVVYEASGDNLPFTAGALYNALADSSTDTNGIFRPWRNGGRPLLPWRRKMENQIRPAPAPCPTPMPAPTPGPLIINPIGPPKFTEPEPEGVSGGMALLLSLASVLGGGGVGAVKQLKETYSEIV